MTTDTQLGQVLAFRKALSLETDRGSALLAGAFLDEELRKLLVATLVDDTKVVEPLFSPNGPFGTFSARIDSAYVLGLLGKNAHRDLHLIRKIRNDFGHSPDPIDFTHPPVAARARELHHFTLDATFTPRKLFVNVVMGLLGVLHGSLALSKHATPSIDLDMPALRSNEQKEAAKEYLLEQGVDGA